MLLSQLKQVVFEIRIGVGLEVGKEHRVSIIFKLVLKRQSRQLNQLALLVIVHISWNIIFVVLIVGSRIPNLSFVQRVFSIGDISAATFPLVSLRVGLHRVNERFHPLRVATVVFIKIDQVELIGLFLLFNVPY